MKADPYHAFLESKVKRAPVTGFSVEDTEIHPLLKPHQRLIVRWALAGGCRAIFASFGLGKSFMQLEIGRLILSHHAGSRILISMPLGVRREFMRDAEKLGIPVTFVRSDAEAEAPGLYLTNHEAVVDGRVTPSRFVGILLDEASVLRSYGSKTFHSYMELCRAVLYRFVATATPNPNRMKELIHYSAFLGIMDSGQALTRFFQRNSEKSNDLTLYPHKEVEFWTWLASWAVVLQRPSDLGFSDEGYDLPPLTVHWHEVSDATPLTTDRDGQGVMFAAGAKSLQEAARVKKASLNARVSRLVEIIESGRGEESLPQNLLRTEQGCVARKAAATKQARLPEQQREIQSAFQAVAGGQPRTDVCAPESSSNRKCRETAAGFPGLVSTQQSASSSAGAQTEAGALRADNGAIQLHGDDAEWSLRDLPQTDAQFASGSFPLDGEGARSALYEVQQRIGHVQRRSCDDHAGSGLPDQVVVWCDLNDEQREIEKRLKKAEISFSSLYGNQSIEHRENLLEKWISKETSVFLTKPMMYGAGVNLQQCHTMVFVGVGYKAQDFLQAIHRIHRFMQDHACEVHVIYAEAEREIVRTLEAKWAQHDEMGRTMSEVIRRHGLNSDAMAEVLERSIGVERVEVAGENWRMIHNDCVEEVRRWDENAVDLIVTSIPFSNHYEYTPSYNDMGHTEDNAQFFRHMDHLTPELLRVLRPGRIAAVHVKDRVEFGNVTGTGLPTMDPFHAHCILHYIRHGFDYCGMIHINTDVVRENNGTYRLGYTEMLKDSTKMGVGCPEYVLLLHKPQSDKSKAYADVRVAKTRETYSLARWQIDAHAFWRSSGDRFLTPEEWAELPTGARGKLFTEMTARTLYDHEAIVRVGEALEASGALPKTFMGIAPGSTDPMTWDDVLRINTLNKDQSLGRREKHVCPLQVDIVDRLIERFSNTGEEVFDPFGGLGTVPVRALHLGRCGIGTELNPGYFRDALRYLEMEAARQAVPTLFGAFDAIAAEAVAAPATAPEAVDLLTAIRIALGERPAPAALGAVDLLACVLAGRPADVATAT